MGPDLIFRRFYPLSKTRQRKNFLRAHYRISLQGKPVHYAKLFRVFLDSRPVQDCLKDCFKSSSGLPYVDNGKLQLPKLRHQVLGASLMLLRIYIYVKGHPKFRRSKMACTLFLFSLFSFCFLTHLTLKGKEKKQAKAIVSSNSVKLDDTMST